MAKNKPNPLLAKYEAIYRAQFLRRLQIANQMGLDVAIITANEVLGARRWPGRTVHTKVHRDHEQNG